MLEINLAVYDCEAALGFYEKLFGAERQSLTALPPGQNEAIIMLEGIRIRLFDENRTVNFIAPKRGEVLYFCFRLNNAGLQRFRFSVSTTRSTID